MVNLSSWSRSICSKIFATLAVGFPSSHETLPWSICHHGPGPSAQRSLQLWQLGFPPLTKLFHGQFVIMVPVHLLKDLCNSGSWVSLLSRNSSMVNLSSWSRSICSKIFATLAVGF